MLPASPPAPFLIARSMSSLFMFSFFARSITARRPGEVRLPAAFFDSSAISFDNFPKILLRLPSVTAFLFFICDHLLCPDICLLLFLEHTRRGYHYAKKYLHDRQGLTFVAVQVFST